MLNKDSSTKLTAAITLTLIMTAAILFGISQVQASTILEDGFESDLSNWILRGSPTIISAPVANGSHAVKCPMYNASTLQRVFNQTDTLTVEYYILSDITNLTPNTNLKFGEICDSRGNYISRLYIAANGSGALGWQFSYLIGSTGYSTFIADNITANTWYHVYLTQKTDINSAYQLWINNTSVFSVSNLTKVAYPQCVLNLGCITNSGYSSGNLYLDTLRLTDTVDPVGTPTPTPAPTSTPAPTATPTETPDPTATPTATPTTTPTLTPSATPDPTAIPTPTVTPNATVTPTSEPTQTQTTSPTQSSTNIPALVAAIIIILTVIGLLFFRSKWHKPAGMIPR
jgi:hypothetical protein